MTKTLKDLFKIVIVGHVDHGKSTLVGRLIYETGSLPNGKFEEIQETSRKRGMPFEWAFLLDALQAERDQGITIDTTQIWFKTEARHYVMIDAPGHKEFLKNMITGASSADGALLVIDAHEGVAEQSRRHGYLLHLLGVRQVGVLVNKMDLVNFDEKRFVDIEKEFTAYLNSIGVTPKAFVPIAARDGENIVKKSDKMPWYQGGCVVDLIDTFDVVTRETDLSLRLPVQDVYKFDERRLIVGRIETGTLKVGDQLLFSPSNKTANVKSIEIWPEDRAQPKEAGAGQCVGITLDEQIFVERGDVASHFDHAPKETDVFKAKCFWLGHKPLVRGGRYKLKLMTREVPVTVQTIEAVIDTQSLDTATANEVPRNAVGEIVLRTRDLVALDSFADSPRTGRFVLVDGYDIVGGGIISMEGYADQRQLLTRRATNVFEVDSRVTDADRIRRYGHPGGVIWFTGLSGAGKTTLAIEVERRLFNKGLNVYVLDGDNLRHGLNGDLTFSPEDRAENIRRAGEVAALFSKAGFIVLTSFISPYRSDRERARLAASSSKVQFHELYVKADLNTCETRDPKGLYKKARAGQIKDFTGVSAPYEAPDKPDVVIDTSHHDVESCVNQIMDYVDNHFLTFEDYQI